jgi:hypothetical protein
MFFLYIVINTGMEHQNRIILLCKWLLSVYLDFTFVVAPDVFLEGTKQLFNLAYSELSSCASRTRMNEGTKRI